MKKKFKYKLAYNCADFVEQQELKTKLLALSYKTDEGDFGSNKNYTCIMTNYSGENNCIGNNKVDCVSYFDRELIDNLDLFLALAAQTSNEEFFEGEYVKCIKEYEGQYTFNKIYQIRRLSNGGQGITTMLDDEGSDSNGFSMAIGRFVKATKEELISEFSKKEVKETIKEEKQMTTIDRVEELEKQLAELKLQLAKEEEELVFEKDKWYVYSNDYTDESLVKCVNPTQYENYGIWEGDWRDDLVMEDSAYPMKNWKLADSETIEKYLTAEAKKRGFKEGVKFKDVESDVTSTVNRDISTATWYTRDALQVGNSIYCNAKWAEILPSIPVIKIKGYGAKFYKDTVEFGCQPIKLSTIKDIVRIQQQLGVDLTKEAVNIQEIVEYYKTNPKLGDNDDLPF